MSFGLPVLVSDIPANREVNLPKERYFRCGDVPDLAGKLAALMSRPLSDTDKQTLWNLWMQSTHSIFQQDILMKN
jgi:alpha-maltose-1-phosphate synthase